MSMFLRKAWLESYGRTKTRICACFSGHIDMTRRLQSFEYARTVQSILK